MKIIIWLIACVICNFRQVAAQPAERTVDTNQITSTNWQNIKPLKVGDQCPNFKLSNIINFSKKSASLSDFKGKWLILDFWATWCSPCIAGLPKVHELQRKFQDRVQFMPVTTDKEEDVKILFAKLNDGKGVHYPSVVADPKGTIDTALHRLFKRHYIPHYVWINPTGVVKAITESNQVTAQNIQRFLDGEDFKLPVKRDALAEELEESKPLIVSGLDQNSIKYFSGISGYYRAKESPGFQYLDPSRLKITNSSISKLYRFAYSYSIDATFYPAKRTFIEIPDSVRLQYVEPENPTNDEFETWALENSFSYQLQLPFILYGLKWTPKYPMDEWQRRPDYKDRKAKACKIMVEDLNRFFDLRGTIEKRKMTCYVLVCTDSSKLNSKSGTSILSFDKGLQLKLQNKSLDDFINPFKDYFFSRAAATVLNETGFQGKCDIEITTQLSNLSKVNNAIEKYGLKFIEVEREVEVLVLRKVDL